MPIYKPMVKFVVFLVSLFFFFFLSAQPINIKLWASYNKRGPFSLRVILFFLAVGLRRRPWATPEQY